MRNKIFYSVCYKDIQEVAESELGRKLSEEEIKSVEEKISDRIDWYEPISSVLAETFDGSEKEKPLSFSCQGI
ncbi:hypothetical protein FACS189454_06720 [Planctomycetales bacterium]|nr:hypothetical protein FACS189443_0530 [Planctomycetales bacterium]GHT46112.1 hypothetical protein FACS189454_06720 [Planctomycetales bacterium]